MNKLNNLSFIKSRRGSAFLRMKKWGSSPRSPPYSTALLFWVPWVSHLSHQFTLLLQLYLIYGYTDSQLLSLDNTNVRHDEVETYMSLAKQHGYVVVLVEPKTPWKFQARELSTRNKHNVSFVAIRRRIEQYDEILPHYFGWFVSPPDCVRLKTMAKDVLWKCLQIPDFQECIKAFSGDYFLFLQTCCNFISSYCINRY